MSVSLPSWPLAMRKRGAAGVSGGPQSNAVSFDPDIGPAITRRRATSFVRNYRVSFDALSLAEYTAFQTFFHTTLQDGTLPFAWYHPMTDGLTKARFILSSNQPYEETRSTKGTYNITCDVQFTTSIDNAAVSQLGDDYGMFLDCTNNAYAMRFSGDSMNVGNAVETIQCVRASSATYLGSNFLIQTAPANTARFPFSQFTGLCRGLLTEPASSNQFLRSEEFDNAAWGTINASVVANGAVAPDGATTGDFLKENNVNGAHYVYQGVGGTTNTVPYTVSVWVKASTRSQLMIWAMEGSPFTRQVAITFDLSNGTIILPSLFGGAVSVTGTIELFPFSWYRVSATYVLGGAVGSQQVRLCLSNANSNIYTGNNTSGLYLWGAQLEAFQCVTSYIKTTTTALARLGDVCAFGQAFPYQAGVGTLYAETERIVPSVLTSIVAFGGVALAGTAGNGIAIRSVGGPGTNNYCDGIGVNASVAQFDTLGQTTVFGQVCKAALAYQTNDVAFVADGTLIDTDTVASIPTLSGMYIGSDGGTNAPGLPTLIRKLAYWPSRFSNIKMQQKTAA